MVKESLCIWNVGPLAPFAIFKHFYFKLGFEATNSHQGVANGVEGELLPGSEEGGERFPSMGFHAEFIALGTLDT